MQNTYHVFSADEEVLFFVFFFSSSIQLLSPTAYICRLPTKIAEDIK